MTEHAHEFKTVEGYPLWRGRCACGCWGHRQRPRRGERSGYGPWRAYVSGKLPEHAERSREAREHDEWDRFQPSRDRADGPCSTCGRSFCADPEHAEARA